MCFYGCFWFLIFRIPGSHMVVLGLDIVRGMQQGQGKLQEMLQGQGPGLGKLLVGIVGTQQVDWDIGCNSYLGIVVRRKCCRQEDKLLLVHSLDMGQVVVVEVGRLEVVVEGVVVVAEEVEVVAVEQLLGLGRGQLPAYQLARTHGCCSILDRSMSSIGFGSQECILVLLAQPCLERKKNSVVISTAKKKSCVMKL